MLKNLEGKARDCLHRLIIVLRSAPKRGYQADIVALSREAVLCLPRF
jgi:hypothetical protein